ncbi:alpha/beta hydrolase [Aeoliella sp. ICT_H6.2]|uniref:Alpha/beta hydrolase n=1 Tax=Aeoliella straminimaris TaxID=2954799 RepID=A0A9X2JFQ5_9BACT|nr:alpha/beta hydrolase [Aeoliella straminimaris]MCO6044305.1 alpha/beta hydrolase [Aeoliella straminimaris]
MSKPQMVLVSGWGQTAKVLLPLAEQLEPITAVKTTSVYDLGQAWKNAGRDALSSADEPSHYAQQLRVSELETQASIVLGWSMGAMVALEAARAYPKLVQRLILVAGCGSFCSREAYPPGANEASVEEMRRGLVDAPEATLRLFLSNVYRRSVTRDELAHKTSQALDLDCNELDRGLEYLKTRDLRPLLPEVDQPALIVHGQLDRVIPVAAAGYLHEHLQRPELHLFSEGTHALCEQYPQELLELIRGFLADDEQPFH